MVVSQRFYHRHVKLPAKDKTPPEIRDNLKLYPFFRDCQGAVDGAHVDAFVPDDAIPYLFRNCQGNPFTALGLLLRWWRWTGTLHSR
jgi:hypothetical protein